jgi:3-oxoadipate enol-lactonase/4-carboxymuconolactone decarboxylase
MPFAHRDGVRLYWRLDGRPDRPALLLLNAIGTDMGVWDAVVPLITPNHLVLRMDIRGHGASDAPSRAYDLEMLAADALSVMDAAGVGSASLCGLSLGAMVAMTLALRAPERVSALVCACSSPQMDPTIWSERIDTVRARGPAAIVEAAMQRAFTPAFRRTHPETAATIGAGLAGMSADGYIGCAAAIRDMQLKDRIAAIQAPTLVISGAQDVATPFIGHGERIAAAIAGAQAVSLEAAHLACLEAPGAFAARVLNFLARTEVGQAADEAAAFLFQAGLKVRRTVLGDAWVDRALEARTPFTSDFQAMITRYAWNEIWGRPGLDFRTRRLLVIAITAAMGRWEEFRLHVRAGLEQGGFSQDDLKEVLMQTAIYAGVPCANTAFKEAEAAMRELSAIA